MSEQKKNKSIERVRNYISERKAAFLIEKGQFWFYQIDRQTKLFCNHLDTLEKQLNEKRVAAALISSKEIASRLRKVNREWLYTTNQREKNRQIFYKLMFKASTDIREYIRRLDKRIKLEG